MPGCRDRCAAVHLTDQAEQGRRCKQHEGFNADEVGPVGPLAPYGQPIKHRPRRCQILHLEIRLERADPRGTRLATTTPAARQSDQAKAACRTAEDMGKVVSLMFFD